MFIELRISDWKKNGYIADKFAKIPDEDYSYTYLVLPKCPDDLRDELRKTNSYYQKKYGETVYLFAEDFKDGEIKFMR